MTLNTEFFDKLEKYLEIIREYYPGTIVIEIGGGPILFEEQDEINTD